MLGDPRMLYLSSKDLSDKKTFGPTKLGDPDLRELSTLNTKTLLELNFLDKGINRN